MTGHVIMESNAAPETKKCCPIVRNIAGDMTPIIVIILQGIHLAGNKAEGLRTGILAPTERQKKDVSGRNGVFIDLI